MNISELRDRYGLKTRQSIYDWCKAAKITLAKDEKKRAYATPEQIEVFDQLSEHLANGGTLKNFSPILATTIETVNQPIDTSIDILETSIDTVNHALDTPLELSKVNDLVNLVQAIANLTTKPDPLSHHRALEEARRNDWILTSGEIERLLGVAIRTKGDYCERGCWRFTKVGRVGREQGWRVSKI
jgi:hypothetical protein